MAEDGQKTIAIREADRNRGPRFAILPNFDLKFPPLKQESKTITEGTSVGEEVSEAKKPDMVRFPDNRPNIPPLKLEVEESEQEMNPRNLWQVYALGGFLVLRWIWVRWKERRPKDESSI